MLKLSDNELRWYVANTCRQEKKIKQRLNTMGIENFIPFQQIARKIHGVDKLIEVPVIPNLVFLHSSRDIITLIALWTLWTLRTLWTL